MKTLRTCLRRLLTALLIGVNLLLVGYLSRRLWLEPIVIRQVEALLGEAIQAEVHIDGLGGNWVDSLVVEGATLRGSRTTPLRLVENARIEVAFSLTRLVGGDLSGVRFARVRADRLELDLSTVDEELEQEVEATGQVVLAELLPLLDLAPSGVSVEVPVFRFIGGGGERTGSLTVELAPGENRNRHVRIRTTGVRADVHLAGSGGPAASVDVEVDDPGELLRSLGVANDLHGGRIVVTAIGRDDPLETQGTVDVRDVQRGEAGAIAAHISFHLDPSELRVFELSADVPGLRLRGSELSLPHQALGGQDVLTRTSGGLAVEIDDLAPYAAQLPAEIRGLLPLQGRLQGWLRGGEMEVADGYVQGNGFRVRTLAGRLPARHAGFRTRAGRLELVLSIPEPRTFDVPGLGALVLSGDVHAVVRGSVEEPHANARLDLASGSCAGIEWSKIVGRVDYTGSSLAATGLQVDGVSPAGRPGPTTVTGRAAAQLAADTGLPEHVDVELIGEVAPAWLELAGLPADRVATLSNAKVRIVADCALTADGLPTGSARVEVSDLRWGDGGASSLRARARIAPGEADALQVEVDVGGRLEPTVLQLIGANAEHVASVSPLDYHAAASATLPPGGLPLGRASVSLDGVSIAGLDPLRMRGDVVTDDGGQLRIERLTATGPVQIEASGHLPLAGQGEAALHLHVETDDLASVTALLPGHALRGRARADLSLSGPMAEPTLGAELQVDLEDAQGVLRDLWPDTVFGTLPPEALHLHASARSDQGALSVGLFEVKLGPDGSLLSVSAAGPLPLALTSGGLAVRATDAPFLGRLRVATPDGAAHELDVGCAWRWTDAALRIEDLRVASGPNELTGELRLEDLARAIAGSTRFDDLPVTGRLGTGPERSFDLSRLAPDLLGAQVMAGQLTIAAKVSGRLGQPDPEVDVRLAGGRLKMPNLPLLEQIDAVIHADPGRVELTRCEGRVGAGTMQVTASLDAAPGNLFDGSAESKVACEVIGQDVLLLRKTGTKLRADLDIRAQGSLVDLAVTGQIGVTSGKIVKRVSLLPDLAKRGGAGVEEGIRLPRIPPPFGQSIRYDVGVKTLRPLEIVTHVLNAPIEISAHLRGTGAEPYLDGAVSASSGVLRLPAVSMTVAQAVVTFRAERAAFPDILVKAKGRRHGIDIEATISGSIDKPEIQLSSLPPLPPQELVVLVSTGALPETLANRSTLGQTSFIGSYLAEELLDFYFGSDATDQGESVFDRFHLESGKEISKNGVESLTVEFDLTEFFKLQAERDKYEDYNMGVLYRIKF